MAANRRQPPQDKPDQEETIGNRLGESAQSIWLAGLGAISRMQSEGSRLFDTLVQDGKDYELRQKTTDADDIKGNVEAGLGRAREQTSRTWGKVEAAFDDQVQGVLKRLHIPGSEEIAGLHQEIASLRRRLGDLESQVARHHARCECASAPRDDITGLESE